MTTRNPEAVTPVHSRRTALRTLGTGLAALGALPLLTTDTTAKKRGKRRKRSSESRDRCLRQVAECEAIADKFCSTASDRDLCRATLSRCCQPLGTCDGAQSIQCVIDAFTQKT